MAIAETMHGSAPTESDWMARIAAFHGRSDMGQKVRKVFQLVGPTGPGEEPELWRNSTNSQPVREIRIVRGESRAMRKTSRAAKPPRILLRGDWLGGRESHCRLFAGY